MTRLIVAGSRNCTDYNIVQEAIELGLKELEISPSIILSGDATGVDRLGEKYAKENGINCVKYLPRWKDITGKPTSEIKSNKFGKYWVKAGFERNQIMVDNADALIAIDLGTNGTADVISRAKKAGLKVYIYQPDEEECFGFNFWDD
jgi:predicted Rossmann-fold nucleotide-binding protein